MTFHPFDVTIPHIFYAVLGGFIVLFGMFSLLIREKLYIGEAPLAFVFGVIIGPYCANLIDPRAWGGGSDETVNTITLEVTRVILAVGVFAIGVELPKAYMQRHWKSLLYLLLPVMTWGWMVSAGLIFALIPGLSFLSSLAVAACLTPTDPILAAAVVGGKYADKHVPAHLRHLLAAESGCNDGAAFPFLYIAIYLVTQNSDKHAVQDWFLVTWLYEVTLGIVLGSVLGFGFRHLMKFCERKDLIDRQSYVAQYVSLAMFTIGVTTLLGSDDLLAAFSCGTAFAWDGFFNRQIEQAVFSSVIDLLFNIAAFIFIGAWMPFSSFANADLTLSVWRLIVIAILVLLLRRLPIMLALYKWIPDVKTFREAIFSGHFGPIGVGAVFISTLAAETLPVPVNPSEDQVEMLAATIQPIVAFMVLCSITIHGLSIPFFSLGRRVHSVSRTWSRHQSMDPMGPEWATQARRVSRPEDIIINRDSALERGDLRSDEKFRHPETSAEDDLERKSDVPSTPSSGALLKPDVEGDPGAISEGRPDNVPDGVGLDAEWQEGPDVIVERQEGPGEEVEVQVKRGAAEEGDSGANEVLHAFRGPPGEIEKMAKRLKGSLMDKTRFDKKEVENEVVKAKNEVEEGVRDIGEEVLERVGISVESPSESSGQGSDCPPTNDDEDEEGWSSDQSGSSSSAKHHRHAGETGRKRSKSPKQKASAGHGGRRHRTSIRRSLLGRMRSSTASSSSRPVTAEAESESDERGRHAYVSTSERTRDQGHSLGHRRVESLRVPLTRSSSPTHSVRSVRFASDSGSATRDERESAISPTNSRQVAFDLPHDSKT
ncbi:Sodium/hydrogen exchanger family-domain-containing protein [Phellopilus nigrolimitatus]|nr:Sodium/hydrogen exchanger family-domain-containing protein [Phellopilus nigrolimitatus]